MYPDLSLFIDGKAAAASDRETLAVINPATGAELGRLPCASERDLDQAVEAASAAFPLWRKTPARDRGRVLRRAADLIRDRVDAIATIMTLEQGKPLAEARGELLASADILDWSAEEGRRTYGRIVPAQGPGVRQMVVLEPVGVVAAFTPWNFPALTPARKIGGALAAGCTMVLKAAEETPGTALELARALHDAGLPKGVLNLVFGDPSTVSAHLIASPLTRKISFTGSVGVGKHLMRQAADGLKRTTMELGGHAPVLIFEDADVEMAATALAIGKFRNAGQVCISPTRFYVQESVFERFTARFVDAAKALTLGNGLDEGVTMGPLVNARRVKAMERLMADVTARGGEILAGGERFGSAGSFFQPTVVIGLTDEALIMTEEPFGPIAPITLFASLDEVIGRANSLPLGLASYAFTASNDTAMAVADDLKAGMVGINTLAISTPETPFGGVGDSGHGQEGGIEGVQAYLDVKFIAHARAA